MRLIVLVITGIALLKSCTMNADETLSTFVMHDCEQLENSTGFQELSEELTYIWSDVSINLIGNYHNDLIIRYIEQAPSEIYNLDDAFVFMKKQLKFKDKIDVMDEDKIYSIMSHDYSSELDLSEFVKVSNSLRL